MLLETFKSLVARFKQHEPTRNENAIQPISLLHPSTTDALAELSAATPNQNLALPTLNPLPTGELILQMAGQYSVIVDQASDPTSTSGFFANSRQNVINNSTMVSVSNTFETGGGAIMQLLESKTLQGAEHDSSARYPPPKCHPETRQSLRGDISDWIVSPKRGWRMLYVLGPAGVGKSAVAQTVADDCKEADCLGASCFISRPNHRNDPDGVIPTLAYQLAVKHEVYRRIISQKLAHDPTILRKTRRVQFKELLIDPFNNIMTRDVSAIQRPLLIIIDGLDECKDQRAQCEFIELISDHVRNFPEFPLLWLICSRPEWHLKYVLSQADFQVTCRREEISADDQEGRLDVSRYLRSEFRNIRLRHSDSLDHNWPSEVELLRITTAASGLFAFASTIIRFVDDAGAGDPAGQLRLCMRALEGFNMPGAENPYLTLDLLYQHVLISIPSKIFPITMRILGMSIYYPHHADGPSQSAQSQANFLRIGKSAFNHALKPLHSVLRIPLTSDAFNHPIEFYHASFGDFLRDPGRSGVFCLDEAAIHYDVALAALAWHIGSKHEIPEGDSWTSPSEDAQTRCADIKSLSLTVLWKACSRVKGQNAMNLYRELQKLDFNVLDSHVPTSWEFGDFLSWLNLQERDSSTTPKLLNSLHTYKDCSEVEITNVTISQKNTFGFTPGGLHMSNRNHFDLGNGEKRRHVHATVIPQNRRLQGGPSPSAEAFQPDSFFSPGLFGVEADPTILRVPSPDFSLELPPDPPPSAVKSGWREIRRRQGHAAASPTPPLQYPAPSTHHIDIRRQVESWTTWQPDPSFIPSPPDPPSPGLFGSRSPSPV